VSEIARQELSFRYLQGDGVEVGALHYPLPVSGEAKVRYVDRMSVPHLRKQYRELDHLELVDVDVIDDGELLASFANDSLDFVIANHMLEHCENPIGTLRNHFEKIKEGGIAYYAVPDKNYTFDRERSLTTFDHLVFDDKLGALGSREQHFREWVTYISKKQGDEAANLVKHLMEINYSIHFHVWDYNTFREFIVKVRQYLANMFKVEELIKNDEEIICILRKCQDVNLGEQIEVVGMEQLESHKAAGVTAEMEAKNEELSLLVTALKGEIDDLRCSTSWRFTEPLRACKRIVQRALNRK
jgi:SAM-dependent methyltransferase